MKATSVSIITQHNIFALLCQMKMWKLRNVAKYGICKIFGKIITYMIVCLPHSLLSLNVCSLNFLFHVFTFIL